MGPMRGNAPRPPQRSSPAGHSQQWQGWRGWSREWWSRWPRPSPGGGACGVALGEGGGCPPFECPDQFTRHCAHTHTHTHACTHTPTIVFTTTHTHTHTHPHTPTPTPTHTHTHTTHAHLQVLRQLCRHVWPQALQLHGRVNGARPVRRHRCSCAQGGWGWAGAHR